MTPTLSNKPQIKLIPKSKAQKKKVEKHKAKHTSKTAKPNEDTESGENESTKKRPMEQSFGPSKKHHQEANESSVALVDYQSN